MPRRTSSGHCFLCGRTYSKDGMPRHLSACLKESTGRGTPTRFFLLRVESIDRPGYWLHLEAAEDVPLQDLDTLLRDVWVRCCDHGSESECGRLRGQA